jgi:hypothetical protein
MTTPRATPALRRAYASAPGGVDIWPTLTLTHALWSAPQYLTNAPNAFTATLETSETVTFLAFPFAVVLPTVDGTGSQDLQVTISNADQTVADLIQQAHADPTQRIQAVYREFLASAVDAPQSPPLRLEFDLIQIGEDAITGTAGRSDILNRRFPGTHYDVQHFPGLDR